MVLLQKQVQLLQDEVTRLRLKGEEPAAEKAELGSKKLTNGETGDTTKGKKVRNIWVRTKRNRGAAVGTTCEPPLAPSKRSDRKRDTCVTL